MQLLTDYVDRCFYQGQGIPGDDGEIFKSNFFKQMYDRASASDKQRKAERPAREVLFKHAIQNGWSYAHTKAVMKVRGMFFTDWWFGKWSAYYKDKFRRDAA